MRQGNTARKIIYSWGLVLSVCLLPVLADARASSPVRIKVVKGQSKVTWKGVVRDGNQKFRLHLAKGGSVKLESDDVYTWRVITPKGKKTGCGGEDYCGPESETAPAPYPGDYIIDTDYRMSSCADCPVAKTRKVTVTFVVK